MNRRKFVHLDREFIPEKLLFLIDLDAEMNSTDFIRGNGTDGPTRIDLVKQAIVSLIIAKQALSNRHEFAIGILTEEVTRVIISFLKI